MSRYLNRVEMTVTAAPGTGSFVTTGATTGNRGITAAGGADQESFRYLAKEGGTWEIGDGVWTAATATLTRSLRESSSGALIAFGTGVTISVIPDASTFRQTDQDRWFDL